MLSASVQQLQEPRGDTDFTNLHMASNDEFTHLAVHNEELSAQLKSEIQTKELLAVEVHKLSGL